MKRTSSGTCVPTLPFLTNQKSVSLPKISLEFSLKLSRITGSSKFLKSWDKRGFSKRRWKFVEIPFGLKLHWFRAKVMKFVKICSHFFFTLLLSSWRSFLRVLFVIVNCDRYITWTIQVKNGDNTGTTTFIWWYKGQWRINNFIKLPALCQGIHNNYCKVTCDNGDLSPVTQKISLKLKTKNIQSFAFKDVKTSTTRKCCWISFPLNEMSIFKLTFNDSKVRTTSYSIINSTTSRFRFHRQTLKSKPPFTADNHHH